MAIHIFHLANKFENSYTGTMNELSLSRSISFFSSVRSCIQIFKIIVVSRNSNRHENELCDDFLVIFGKLARWCSTSDENQQTYKHWEFFFHKIIITGNSQRKEKSYLKSTLLIYWSSFPFIKKNSGEKNLE